MPVLSRTQGRVGRSGEPLNRPFLSTNRSNIASACENRFEVEPSVPTVGPQTRLDIRFSYPVGAWNNLSASPIHLCSHLNTIPHGRHGPSAKDHRQPHFRFRSSQVHLTGPESISPDPNGIALYLRIMLLSRGDTPNRADRSRQVRRSLSVILWGRTSHDF